MKFLKRFLLLLVTVLLFTIVFNYPKLNILAGYSAKNIASSVFVAGRTMEFTDTNDNDFSPVNLANDAIDLESKIATSDAFKLLTRKAFYREEFDAVVLADALSAHDTLETALTAFGQARFPVCAFVQDVSRAVGEAGAKETEGGAAERHADMRATAQGNVEGFYRNLEDLTEAGRFRR